ncbi:hypothetical protein BDV38DRAFT_257236 [Aspergillus pseudotamarii]|uniref:Uncharacterized protein n=2 Tax=Aspergillus subgen. Circumdati TaxID=2720871 RepID=A0A5N6SJJ2_ASPPS|nr:uncharacterized protein BDV38DRAFT_257236 [Aspergillus pseudotamarii]XP_031934919.1 uncharacterized protein BDV37DRAFT_265381 [Aspergillus pseudonomiae]KAE8133851.1 hypothetical protein BDV38DRAFT_257236 [Aspergillus pseudotamarii]KAE8397600.1 hypothetical protein BDV37DRAFT_265381 [Aspergillus pseudonomiae]
MDSYVRDSFLPYFSQHIPLRNMANQVSLLAYLQHGPPRIPIIEQGQSTDNTTNTRYSADDITYVGHWATFNLNTILHQHQAVLTNSRREDEAMPLSPPQAINSEPGLRQRFSFYMNQRVRRALRSGFDFLTTNNQLANRTVVDFGEGNLAQLIEQFTPDTAYYDPLLPAPTRPNRVPGDLKPSFKWSLALRNSPTPYGRKQFKQALAQVNYYMKQHETHFGFILTDRELVAIRRLDRNGRLELSDSVSWITKGSECQPRLTVLLALWYLGMLASDNLQWHLP